MPALRRAAAALAIAVTMSTTGCWSAPVPEREPTTTEAAQPTERLQSILAHLAEQSFRLSGTIGPYRLDWRIDAGTGHGILTLVDGDGVTTELVTDGENQWQRTTPPDGDPSAWQPDAVTDAGPTPEETFHLSLATAFADGNTIDYDGTDTLTVTGTGNPIAVLTRDLVATDGPGGDVALTLTVDRDRRPSTLTGTIAGATVDLTFDEYGEDVIAAEPDGKNENLGTAHVPTTTD